MKDNSLIEKVSIFILAMFIWVTIIGFIIGVYNPLVWHWVPRLILVLLSFHVYNKTFN